MRTFGLLALLILVACPSAHVRREVCDRYVACALAADAKAGAAVALTYGDGSSCWTDARQGAACVAGCEAGLAALASSGVQCGEVRDAGK